MLCFFCDCSSRAEVQVLYVLYHVRLRSLGKDTMRLKPSLYVFTKSGIVTNLTNPQPVPDHVSSTYVQ